MSDDELHRLHVVATHPEHSRASETASSTLFTAATVVFQVVMMYICARPGGFSPLSIGVDLFLLALWTLLGLVLVVQYWRADRKRKTHPPIHIELNRYQLRVGDRTLDLARVHRFDPTQDVHLEVGEEQITLPDDYTLGPEDRATLHAGLRARLAAFESAEVDEHARARLDRLRSAERGR